MAGPGPTVILVCPSMAGPGPPGMPMPQPQPGQMQPLPAGAAMTLMPNPFQPRPVQPQPIPQMLPPQHRGPMLQGPMPMMAGPMPPRFRGPAPPSLPMRESLLMLPSLNCLNKCLLMRHSLLKCVCITWGTIPLASYVLNSFRCSILIFFIHLPMLYSSCMLPSLS